MEIGLGLEARLEEILRASPLFASIIPMADEIDLKNWYIAGGAVTQTVWNWKMGLDPLFGIKDIDLVYFDASHSELDQAEAQERIDHLLGASPVPIDVKNEALVHQWYSGKFGYEIPPYKSTEDGIRTWLPAFAIGVRPRSDGWTVFAPFGLEDLFAMVIRPNKVQITADIYQTMVSKFTARWPSAEVVPWS